MRAFVSMACAVALIGSASVAAAQGKSAPKVKTTAGTVHGKSATYKPAAAAPKATGTVKTAKATGSPKTTASTKATKATGHAKTTTTRTTTTGTNAPGTTSTGTTITLTPVQQKLQRNTNLASKLQSRLPAGTDLNTAAAGFRNLGQFVAAVNVSNNLGLDFPTLKTAMVTDGKSLGQAIQSQKGTTVNATQEAQRAQIDADTMIRSTEKNARKSTGNQRP
jgi:hypothetical protein